MVCTSLRFVFAQVALVFIYITGSLSTLCFAENVEISTTGDSNSNIINIPEIPPDCKDLYQFCPQYASQGHCKLNVGWMVMNCPRSCDLCHLRDPTVRCTRKFLNMSSEASYQPGDMNTMFDALESEYSQYGVEILSRDPWVVQFNNFISEIESKTLINKQTHWQRSTETGTSNNVGATGRVQGNQRTSSNSWCFHDCESDPNVAALIQRMEAVTRLSKIHHESLQVLQCKFNINCVQ